MSIHRQMDDWLWYIHAMKYYSAIKEWSTDVTWMNLENMFIPKKSIPKVNRLYDSTHMKIQDRELYRERKQIKSWEGVGRKYGYNS